MCLYEYICLCFKIHSVARAALASQVFAPTSQWLICRLMVELQGQGGGRDWRFFCGLISAFLANSPSIIMARVLSDLSGIFCMFGFYLIMFYSRSLLCTFCSARLRCCTHTKNNDKIKIHFTGWPNDTSIHYDFPLILFLSPLSLKLQGSTMRWWGQCGTGWEACPEGRHPYL